MQILHILNMTIIDKHVYKLLFENNQTQLKIIVINNINNIQYECVINYNDLLNKNYHLIKDIFVLHDFIITGFNLNDNNINLSLDLLEEFIILELNVSNVIINDLLILELNPINDNQQTLTSLEICNNQKELYYQNNKIRICERTKIYYEKNKDKVKERIKKNQQKKYVCSNCKTNIMNNPRYNLGCYLTNKKIINKIIKQREFINKRNPNT